MGNIHSYVHASPDASWTGSEPPSLWLCCPVISVTPLPVQDSVMPLYKLDMATEAFINYIMSRHRLPLVFNMKNKFLWKFKTSSAY